MIFKWLQGKKASPSLKETSSTGAGTPSGGANEPENALPQIRDSGTPSGLEMTDAYYPGHDPIDHYGNGGFRFGPMSHQGALLFLPSGIRRWNAESVSSLTLESFDPILREAEGIEILILGSGPHLVPLELTLATKIRAAGIKLDVIDTGAAVRTLNILLSEDRAVAAALLPVD